MSENEPNRSDPKPKPVYASPSVVEIPKESSKCQKEDCKNLRIRERKRQHVEQQRQRDLHRLLNITHELERAAAAARQAPPPAREPEEPAPMPPNEQEEEGDDNVDDDDEEEAFVPPPPPIGFRYCLHGYPCILPYNSSPYCGAGYSAAAQPSPSAFAFYQHNAEVRNRQNARAAATAAAAETTVSSTVNPISATAAASTSPSSSSFNLVNCVRDMFNSFKLSPPSALPYETELAVERERLLQQQQHPAGVCPAPARGVFTTTSHVNPAGTLLQRAALAVRNEQQKLPRPGIARATNFTRNEINFLVLIVAVIALIAGFFMPTVMGQRALGEFPFCALHIPCSQ